jgi:transposase
MRVAVQVVLSIEEREELERLAAGRRFPARVVERAGIVLLAAEGKQDREIARVFGVSRRTVSLWRHRFVEKRIPGILKDAPRSGRRRRIGSKLIAEIIRKTTQETPTGRTHWSTRSLAKVMGLSPSTIGRVWRSHGLKPHLSRTFKVSRDPKFLEKLNDIIALYVNPPERALVFSVDEKSQIQALDRTQPGLPLVPGRAGTMTHDYKRNGTTTLFTALNTQDGTVIGTCMPQHRHQEWLKFLRLIERKTPKNKDIHLIADNYATHKHPEVQAWLERHPRFIMHFTPTSASWLNMVERFFRDLTQNRLRRGVFRSVGDLMTAIDEYLEHHNRDPKPYIWTKSASDILEKVTRAWQAALKAVSV